VHYDRTQFIDALSREIKVTLFPNKELGNSSFQTAELAASANAVLDVQMRADIPLYLNVRPYQYIGAGALFFHDRTEQIRHVFEEGNHFVGYETGDVESFMDGYRYYVNQQPHLADEIRRKGFEYCQKYHSTEERVKFVIDLLKGRVGNIRKAGLYNRVFETAELQGDRIVIEGKAHRVIRGKHALYIPALQMKIVWSYSGKIESLVDWEKGRNAEKILNQTFNDGVIGFDQESMESILNEFTMLNELARLNLGPAVRGVFYIKNMIADNIHGAAHCDSMGCYGFFIDDASKLDTRGEYSYERFNELMVESGKVRASETALGDVKKPDNIVNGYLIDVRRTLFDMMQWTDTAGFEVLRKKIEYHENIPELQNQIEIKTAYPKGQTSKNYQMYWLKDHYAEGVRDTLLRYNRMGLADDLRGKSVLDLGCNLGALSVEAYRRGARFITGLDLDVESIECARGLARANGFQINYQVMDLRPIEAVQKYLAAYYKHKDVDIVFAQGLHESLGENLWELLDALDWAECYVESHRAPKELSSTHVVDMIKGIDSLKDVQTQYLGLTEDFGPRCLWRLTRQRQHQMVSG
jgi:hypothetical protein